MNQVVTENNKPGTTAWRNAYGTVDQFLRSRGIEGYCSKNSVNIGDKLEIKVNSSTAYFVDIYRMGFYGGAGARHMQQIGYLEGTVQDVPPIGDLQSRECDWSTSITLTIPDDWLSGVYLGRLTQVDIPTPRQSYVIFIVTDDRICDFLFKCSDTTWAAYNGWPDDYSLYNYYGAIRQSNIYWGPDVKVSFDRPYKMPHIDGASYYPYDDISKYAWMVGASQFLTFEYPLLFWMESQGYDVSYMSCLDLHSTSAVALRRRARALLAVGHDEYYSPNMYNNLKDAVSAADNVPENGLSVAFFCGGSVTGAIEFTPSTAVAGRVDRNLQRVGRWGPIQPWLLAIQPEQAEFTQTFPDSTELLGAGLVEPGSGVADWSCASTGGGLGAQFYRNTGLSDGDSIANLIGHEYTGSPATIAGLEVLANGAPIADDGADNPIQYTATIYPGGKRNYVFNASTMWWPQWLNSDPRTSYPPGFEPTFVWRQGQQVIRPRIEDMRKVQQMTANLFDLFLG
jgi:hypothetical protein